MSGAVPTLREAADVVTPEDNGRGTAWFFSALVDDDAAKHAAAMTRRDIPSVSGRTEPSFAFHLSAQTS